MQAVGERHLRAREPRNTARFAGGLGGHDLSDADLAHGDDVAAGEIVVGDGDGVAEAGIVGRRTHLGRRYPHLLGHALGRVLQHLLDGPLQSVLLLRQPDVGLQLSPKLFHLVFLQPEILGIKLSQLPVMDMSHLDRLSAAMASAYSLSASLNRYIS